MFTSCFNEEIGYTQIVNSLQTYGRSLQFGSLTLVQIFIIQVFIKYIHVLIMFCSEFCFSEHKSTKIIPVIEYNSLYLHHKIVSKNETE